jgi:putative transposase
MSFVKVMIHAVWGTKNRQPILTDEVRQKIIEHIKENAKTKQIYVDSINGHNDHLHCLFGLNAQMSVSKAIQLIKGESAFWINKEKLTKTKFEWADEYFAVSVSESIIGKVRTYINNQQDHHKKITFNQEYESFINQYNFNVHG